MAQWRQCSGLQLHSPRDSLAPSLDESLAPLPPSPLLPSCPALPHTAPHRSPARRLSALQQIPVGEAATPSAVASALRDLDIDTFFGRILFNRC
jgi:hypothetical protein